LLSSLFATTLFYAQDAQTDYNKWSVELSGGMHKPARPFAAGYYTDSPQFTQFAVGTRYMCNNKTGVKLDFGYHMIEDGKNSQPFESTYWRASLQGVVNVGNVLDFHTWTNSLGLLFHAGAGYGQLIPKSPMEYDNPDQTVNVIAGLTPQLRLGNRVALFGDLTLLGNFRQDFSWDGTGTTHRRGFNAYMVNISAGINVYLGKHEKHADWVGKVAMDDDKLSELERRIAKIETDLIDSDQDGVPDYLDREPNTPSGVAVDAKGRAIDKNNNGIPDEMERALDSRYTKKGEAVASGSGSSLIKHLLDEGYVNVYFQFNSTKPETYSLEAINYLVRYMQENPSAKAELIGYADEIGNPQYNQQLSERRAKAVYDI